MVEFVEKIRGLVAEGGFGFGFGLTQKFTGFSSLVYFGFGSRKSGSEPKLSDEFRSDFGPDQFLPGLCIYMFDVNAFWSAM